MKIAITHPTTFARVRRGTERFVDELAVYLSGKGHEVVVVACKAGAPELVHDRGFTIRYHRRLWVPSLAGIGVFEHHPFLLTTFWALLGEKFDVVHSCSFTDGYAACQARRFTGSPTVLTVNALPWQYRESGSASLGGAVFGRAVCQANAVVACSDYVHDYVSDRWGRACASIACGVDLDRFPLSKTRDHSRPVILCTSAVEEPRKGGRLLLRAFDQLKRLRPEAILQIAVPVSENVQRELLSLVSPPYHQDVQFCGVGRAEDLPALYGRAAVSVLPSYGEPFGIVLIESLATGTPVVGTRHGAIPEIVGGHPVGTMFDPGPVESGGPSNVEGLVRALAEGLDLSRLKDTPDRCRARAGDYSWSVIGPQFEDLYRQVVTAQAPEAKPAVCKSDHV